MIRAINNNNNNNKKKITLEDGNHRPERPDFRRALQRPAPSPSRKEGFQETDPRRSWPAQINQAVINPQLGRTRFVSKKKNI